MRPNVLVIDNYDSFTHNILQIIKEDNGCDYTLLKNDEITDREVKRHNKILISPGPGVPKKAIIGLIKKHYRSKGILGICLGHQAIAGAFGGKLIRLPSVVHGMKKEILILNRDDYLFRRLPKRIEAGLYHSWAVSLFDLPACLEVTAVDRDGTIMALAHKEFDLKGIQFHPESIMTGYGKKILQNWLSH